MVKNIFLLFFLFFSNQIYAQTYKPLLIQGNRWNNLFTPHPTGFKCGKAYVPDSTGTEILSLGTDTAQIGGFIYWNLVASYDSLAKPGLSYGLIREDTVSEKVYFRGTDKYFPFEVMLYDFSIGLNDTMWYFRQEYWVENDIVKMVDSIKIGTRYCKRIELTSGQAWIEGIGALDGLVSHPMRFPLCGTFYTRTLLCFYNRDSLVFQPDDILYKDCFYPTLGIKSDITSNIFTLNPNPAGDFITTSSNTAQNYSVEIINIQGQPVLTYNNLIQYTQISLLGIKPGFYFVKLSNRMHSQVIKIIKI